MARVVTERCSSHSNNYPEVAAAVGKEEDKDGGTAGNREAVP